MEFFPSEIPTYDARFEVVQPEQSTFAKSFVNSQATPFDIVELEVLEEAVVVANAKATEIKRLKGDSFSSVDVFDERKRAMNLTFVNYINYYVPGYVAVETIGNLDIRRRVSTSLADSIQRPIVYLDDVLMPNLQFFYGFDMSAVDYITINKSGSGEGFLGANGVIRIYTSLDYIKQYESNSFKQVEFPVSFSKRKKFYVPKYEVYNDDFFREYGVIDWIPNCTVDPDGYLNFTVYNPVNTNMTLYIEGVTDRGKFVSETKNLNLNDTN